MSDTEADAIAALATKAAGTAQVLEGPDSRKFLILPAGLTQTEVSDPHGLKLTLPRYISQNVTLQTVDSLIAYVQRFKLPQTLLFADMAQSHISAAVDYHRPPAAAEDKLAPLAEQAQHVAHRASMVLPFSEEWKLWTGIDGRLVGQLDFARFIEENAPDIVAPEPAALLEAVRDLQALRKVNFIKAVRTESGNENFEYTTETTNVTKGGVELPKQFKLKIPVYFGESAVEIFAYLRWKVDVEEGGLTLGIALNRREHVRQAVFKLIATRVAESTGCPVVYGKHN